jgi:hypothetical protein
MNDLARAMVRQNVIAGNYGGGGDRAALQRVAGLPPDQSSTPGSLDVQPVALAPAPQDDDEQKRRTQAAQGNIIGAGGAQPTTDRLGG